MCWLQLRGQVLMIGDTGKACDEVTDLTLAKFFSFILAQALLQNESHLQEL